jgi:hypothetical protein
MRSVFARAGVLRHSAGDSQTPIQTILGRAARMAGSVDLQAHRAPAASRTDHVNVPR